MLNKSGVWVAVTIAMVASLAAAVPASAAQHYGPFASGSPDSGTCGPNWATDTFDRHFTVGMMGGVLTVVEDFKDGSFVTVAGASPGGCDTNPGGTVAAGVTGSLEGYFVIPMSGEKQISADPSCVVGSAAACTTESFINTHFSPACYPVTCSATTFLLHYSAVGQGLSFHEWKNASADRGGNSGDIATT